MPDDIVLSAEEERRYAAAYEKWVAEARESGRGTVPDSFRAGYLAVIRLARNGEIPVGE